MKFEKVVVKIGTSTITNSCDGLPDIEQMSKIVESIVQIKKMKISVVIVSSGAIGIGAAKLGLIHKPKTVSQKQACASVGQYALMSLYDKLFSKYGFLVSQILLTRQVLDGSENEKNARNTFKVLFEAGIVPIVNANDVVSTDELEFGDNDSLSAYVASLIEAGVLIMMTDLDGIFDHNPRFGGSEARLIRTINKIDEKIKNIVRGEPGEFGTGGMETKLMAAEFLSKKNIPTAIVNGSHAKRLIQVLEGSFCGTLIDTAGVFQNF